MVAGVKVYTFVTGLEPTSTTTGVIVKSPGRLFTYNVYEGDVVPTVWATNEGFS